MRKLLIIAQAAILTGLAVYGAQNETASAWACTPKAAQTTETCAR